MNHFKKTSVNLRTLMFTSICFILTSGCYSTKKTVQRSADEANQINWPSEYHPSDATFFVHNTISIKAEPRIVWDILIEAEKWPEWYEGAKDVSVLNQKETKLTDRGSFEWKTMGQDLVSEIKEFEEPYRLSWEARKKNIQGYHA